MTGHEEDLDEWACRAFNPDDMIDVLLPSGAIARVAPDVSVETLAALDRMAALAIKQVADVPAAVPKVRRQKPGHLLKPGGRAAWARGCKCFVIPGLAADGRDEHQAHCPLRPQDDTRR